MPRLTHKRLLDQLNYNPATGIFRWKQSRNRIVAGQAAGSLTCKGYLTIKIDGEAHRAHRLAWFYVHGIWPKGIIDHKDGVGVHNWISNLRDTTQQVNCENKHRARKKKTSRLMGVSFVPKLGKFKAQIVVKGKHKYLGLFDSEQQAHDAYMSEKRKPHSGYIQGKSTA